MSKFSKDAKTVQEQVETHPQATTNYEGGLAYNMEPLTKLYTMASATLLEDKFYTNAKEGQEQLLEAIDAVGKEYPIFLLKLAAYLRSEMNLRSVPVMLLVEATQYLKGYSYIRQYTPRILQRADEPREAIAYWVSRFGDRGANGPPQEGFSGLKKGIAATLPKFDAYQLAKYWGKGKDVTMRDVLRICRPKPRTDEQRQLWGQTVKGELPVPDTWETHLSTKGASKETWEGILPQMGIMAKIRNIRNLLQNDVSDELIQEYIIKPLNDPAVIAKSRQFPYRFYSAYQVLSPDVYGRWSGHSRGREEVTVHPMYAPVLAALEVAVNHSVANVPSLSGRTFITCDNSGSMSTEVSGKSVISCFEIANLLGAVAVKLSGNPLLSVFGTGHQVVAATSIDSVLGIMRKLRDTGVGGATNAYLTIEYLLDNKIVVDRIILFSDMQCWHSTGDSWSWSRSDRSLAEEWEKYKRFCTQNGKPIPYVYSVDLAGYGTAQFLPEDPHVALLSGWSDAIFKFIGVFEEDKKSAVQRIAENW